MRAVSLGLVLARRGAEGEARRRGAGAIEPAHLWLAVLKLARLDRAALRALAGGDAPGRSELFAELESLAAHLAARGIDPSASCRALEATLPDGPGSPAVLHRSAEAVGSFAQAAERAAAEGASSVALAHLAAALQEALGAPGAEPDDRGARKREAAPARSGGGGILERLGRDLTEKARRGDLPVVVGRHDEIRRLARTLTRKHKPNALLVGDAGVGKTAIVEGLARLVAVPGAVPALEGIRIVELGTTELLSGTGHRGELEARVEAVLAEARADDRLVLFVDELHTVLGGGQPGSDLSNMLKPSLARGEIRMIGATTTQEYEKYIARQEAFERRFEVLRIEEPSRDEALEVLRGLRTGLETHHSLAIAEEALAAAVDLAIRHLPDRRLPDKALDLLDQACAEVAVPTITPGRFVDAATPRVVTPRVVARVVATRCALPEALVGLSPAGLVAGLEAHLLARVVGQEEAIGLVSRHLRSALSGVADPRRPVASFLFTGPTGVGKTATAKEIAAHLFGGPEALVTVDLSEYAERHQMARLLGAPPGYVRSDEPGLLPSALRRRPASVVLFDEVEKGHPAVLDLLLQILDEGRLTDGMGRPASFRDAIVVLTSNLTASPAKGRPVGFGEGQAPASNDAVAVLARHLRPELLGRIGQVVSFRPLDAAAWPRLVTRLVDEIGERLRRQGRPVPPADVAAPLLSSLRVAPLGAREVAREVEALVAAWLAGRGEAGSE